jgi:anaerobic ribonucleoside-triphosphate reductase
MGIFWISLCIQSDTNNTSPFSRGTGYVFSNSKKKKKKKNLSDTVFFQEKKK